MYTKEQLNSYSKKDLHDLLDKEFTRDELRQVMRDNKIDCVPTSMSKGQVIDVLISCREGKLKCPSNPYVKIPDEFQGEVRCKKAGKVEINVEKKKKKVIKDSSSESPKKSPKKKSPKKELDLEDIVGNAILSYDGELKTSGDLKRLLLQKGLSEEDFDKNKDNIKILAKMFIKGKKDMKKAKAKPELNLEDIVSKAILSHKGDLKTSGDLKRLLLQKGLSEEDFDKNKDEIKALAKVYIKKKKEKEEEEEDSGDSKGEEEEEEEEEENVEDKLERSISDFILNKFSGKMTELTVSFLKSKLKDYGFTENELKSKENTGLIKKFIGVYGSQLKQLRKKEPKPAPKSVSPKASQDIIQKLKDKLSRPGSPVQLSVPVAPEQVEEEEEEVVAPPEPVAQAEPAVQAEPAAPEQVEEEEDISVVEEESDVESLVDDEEMMRERKQYQRFADISKALNECIIQTLLRV